MRPASLSPNEAERLQALRDLQVLDTPMGESFDRITRLAARMLNAPIALISLVDESRQWFKSSHGIDATETPRDWAFCAHAILDSQTFVVPDASQDERFADNPLVVSAPAIRFYAGAPLETREHFNIGTLCVIDDKPRARLTPQELDVLRDLADAAMNEIYTHKVLLTQARFKALIESSSDAIMSKTLAGIITSWNPAAERIFGYTAMEAIGQPMATVIPPEYAEEEPRILAQIAAGERIEAFETVRIRKDGKRIDISASISPILDHSGKVTGASKIVRDITDTKHLAQSFKDREGRLSAILNTVVDAIITIDERGKIETCNPAAERLFGYTADAMIGQNVKMLMPEPFRGEHDGYLHRYRTTGEPRVIGIGREVVGRRQDGSTFPMDLAVSAVELSGAKMFTGIVRDISARKQAEQSLNETIDRLNLATRSGGIGVWEYDFRNAGLIWDDRMFQLYGLEQDRLPGYDIWVSALHPDDRARAEKALNEAVGGGQDFDAEFRIIRPDGNARSIKAAAQVVRDAEGAPQRIIGVNWDITDRVQAETAKNEFVSTVSHELRTPLTSIKGALGLMQSGALGEVPKAMRSMLTIAEKNSERLVRLINDILDIEKIAAGKMDFKMAPLDLSALVAKAIDANRGYAAEHKVAFALIEAPGSAMVQGDEDRLLQVLANLMSNAAKFSPQGMAVEISVVVTPKGYRVLVRDHGPGIPENFRGKIFEKFSQADSSDTRQKGGSGLGLGIAKAIVEKHGGEIGFDTETGKGTTFHFDIPALAGAVAGGGQADEKTAIGRVLICEDDPDIANLLRLMIEREGFATDRAASAEDAKRMLGGGGYQALILDIALPGQNGLSLVRDLRNRPETRELPIIVVSATSEEGRRKLSGDAFEFIDWLEKPINQIVLAAGLHKAIHKRDRPIPRILHVEDEPDVVAIVNAVVGSLGQVVAAATMKEARELLLREDFDLVILDLMLPDGDGEDLLPLLNRPNRPSPPVIVFSAKDVSPAFARGIQASLLKSMTSNERLGETIKALIASHSAETEGTAS